MIKDGMEKEKNLIIKVIFYSKVNIVMDVDIMENLKNIIKMET